MFLLLGNFLLRDAHISISGHTCGEQESSQCIHLSLHIVTDLRGIYTIEILFQRSLGSIQRE